MRCVRRVCLVITQGHFLAGSATEAMALRSAVRALRAPLSAAACSPRRLHAAPTEPVTHTGQVFDENDYRKVRFVARQKEVNEQFAIDLIKEQPVSQVDSRVVSCDGGGGALGHPKVYINLDKDTKTGTCGYCGLQFKQKPHY